jgi:hypothetical protein
LVQLRWIEKVFVAFTLVAMIDVGGERSQRAVQKDGTRS